MAAAVQRPTPPTSPKGVVPQGSNSAVRNVKATPKHQSTGGPKNTTASENVAATQRNSTHVIRINVLGIAGITVDRKKCNDICRKKGHPAPPKNMRAVVAVARGSQIQGTTTPSKLLARSPDDNVIVSGTAVDGDESLTVNGSRRGDDEERKGIGLNSPQRHVAVWASEDNFSLGSLMTFDACLSTRSLDQRKASVSSKHVPKSFEFMVALTEDSNSSNKVALPFGVANINISGDECPQGETIVLDLPILNLRQARPLASNENGLQSYLMIAIKPKKDEADLAPKKRGTFGRLFGKKSDKKSPRTPSIAERTRFTEAYSTDPSGDAVLRVQLQVIEKAASKFHRESSLAMTEITPGVKPLEQNTKKDDRRLYKDAKTSKTQSIEESSSAGTAASTYESSSAQPVKTGDVFKTQRTSDSNVLLTEGTSTFPITASRTADSETVGSRTLDSRSRTLDSRTIDSRTTASRTVDSETVWSRTVDSRSTASRTVESHTFDPFEIKEKETGSIVDDKAGSSVADDDLGDEYFEERTEAKSLADESEDTPNLTMMKNFFSTRFPACGSLGLVDDEMTHVTADFFGKDVAIPICSAIRPRDFDEETNFTLRQNDTLSTMTMLLSDKFETSFGKQTSFGDQPALQSTLEEDNVTKTSKSTEKGVEMRLHGSSSGPGDNMTATAKAAEASNNSLMRGVTEDSPKGVEKFPEEYQQEEKPRSRSSKRPVSSNMSDRFVKMFRCVPTEVSRSDDAMSYKEAGVPTLVMPDDASTVGELTAITHELHINKETTKQTTLPTGFKRYPVAFGGNGVCSSTNLVDDTAVLRGFEIQRFSSASKRPSENYFCEYDEARYVGSSTGLQPLKKTDSGDSIPKTPLNPNSPESNLANMPVTMTPAASKSEWQPQWV